MLCQTWNQQCHNWCLITHLIGIVTSLVHEQVHWVTRSPLHLLWWVWCSVKVNNCDGTARIWPRILGIVKRMLHWSKYRSLQDTEHQCWDAANESLFPIPPCSTESPGITIHTAWTPALLWWSHWDALVWDCRGEGEVTEAELPPQGSPQAPPHWQQEAPVSLLISCCTVLPYGVTHLPSCWFKVVLLDPTC